MLLTSLTAILDRFEANPDYGFIDTKLDLLSGENFDDTSTPELNFRTSNYVYGWIQGRGLEAMTGHYNWLPNTNLSTDEQKIYRQRLLNLITKVVDSCEELRAKLGGRCWFITTTNGEAVQVTDGYKTSPINEIPAGANYSELFYYKGLYTTSLILNDTAKREIATTNFAQVVTDIATGKFRTDQQAFDPNNPVTYVEGKRLQGPKMIALGGLALLMANQDTSHDWAEFAKIFITDILDNHVNINNRHANVAEYGFIEALTPEGGLYWSNNMVAGDPGHATEFTGLAGKCLKQPIFQQRFPELCTRMQEALPMILKHNFNLGFNPQAGGICKSVNLLNGEKINSDMPWWNLPETMRAATYMLPYLDEAENILSLCDQAFRSGFVNPKVHMMAYQNRDAQGNVIATVPATPDADPGYHTNLSMIDVLAELN